MRGSAGCSERPGGGMGGRVAGRGLLRGSPAQAGGPQQPLPVLAITLADCTQTSGPCSLTKSRCDLGHLKSPGVRSKVASGLPSGRWAGNRRPLCPPGISAWWIGGQTLCGLASLGAEIPCGGCHTPYSLVLEVTQHHFWALSTSKGSDRADKDSGARSMAHWGPPF